MNDKLIKIAVTLTFALLGSKAFGWGSIGHDMSNRAAVALLPPDMPEFFRNATDRLGDLASEPDRWRGDDFEALRGQSTPEHFLDYEYVQDIIDPNALPADRFKFIELLVEKDVPRRHEAELGSIGYAPYRAAELTERLEFEFCRRSLLLDRGKSRYEPNAAGKIQGVEQSILWTAGLLGHYIADLANPHHTTKQFNGWTGPNPRGYATDRGTHSRFESAFVGRMATEFEVARRIPVRPTVHEHYLQSIWQHMLTSNRLVPQLYEIDCTNAFLPGFEALPEGQQGLEFAHDRLAAGAALLRDLWYSAWVRGERRAARLRQGFDDED